MVTAIVGNKRKYCQLSAGVFRSDSPHSWLVADAADTDFRQFPSGCPRSTAGCGAPNPALGGDVGVSPVGCVPSGAGLPDSDRCAVAGATTRLGTVHEFRLFVGFQVTPSEIWEIKTATAGMPSNKPPCGGLGLPLRGAHRFFLRRVRLAAAFPTFMVLSLDRACLANRFLAAVCFLVATNASQYGINGWRRLAERRATVTFGVTGNSSGLNNGGGGFLVRLSGGAPSSESPERSRLRKLGRLASRIAAATHGGIISLIVKSRTSARCNRDRR
jgi:hypothetical protein